MRSTHVGGSSRAETIELFYAYSHKDERLRDKLETHLSILKRNGIISGWHDRKILPGTGWTGEIDERLSKVGIILLLVRADFIASDYCYDKELRRAMERHERGEATVIPVILRPCDWQGAPFGKLQGLPKDMKPVTSWASRDEAFQCVATGIRKAAEELRQRGGKPPRSDAALQSVTPSPSKMPLESRLTSTHMSHRAKWRPDSSTLLRQGPHIEVLISRTQTELAGEKPVADDYRNFLSVH